MRARIYPDMNTSVASNTAANELVHRQGESVNTGDQVSSPVLLGIALAGTAVACLLLRVVMG